MSNLWPLLRRVWRKGSVLLAAGLMCASAHASFIPIGFLSFDATTSTTAQFDIANMTGANAFAPDFPVLNPVTLSNLSLLVEFTGGGTQTFTQSDFVLSLDGLSYDGPTVSTGSGIVPISATLSGQLSPTSLNVGSLVTVAPSFFSAPLTNVGGPLQDGDTSLIFGVTGSTDVPLPSTLALLLAGALAWLAPGALGRARARAARLLRGSALAALALCGSGAALADTSVKLAVAALPSSGVAGVTSVKLVSNGLPVVLANKIVIAIAPTCAAGGPVAGEVDTTGSAIIHVVGNTDQIRFLIPASLAQGSYLVSISGIDTGGTAFASPACSVLSVTNTNTTLNSCLPTSSLAVALGPKVTAYVPNGWWGGTATGVQAVPIEGPGVPVSIATPGVVNSCSSNPATGETVCTANSTDVYRITGTSLSSTATSGATGFASFSGGTCQNCGVAINALTNTAYVTVGITSSPSRSGIQGLNLGSGVFSAPFALSHPVSENISVDAGRSLLLSPGEDSNYGLVQLGTSGNMLAELANGTIGGGIDYDSAAEDCTTGIALTAIEFTSSVGMADLNQASFGAGVWSAPSSVFTFNGIFAAGVSGISVAPGASHLGVATGEFGGQSFAVFKLPATPGTGGTPPTIVDYAYIDILPNTPDGNIFSAGFDPHTITAYTSPNDGKPYALIADWSTGTPTYVAVIDMNKLIAAPRIGATNTVDQSVFDLLGTGSVRYVATH